MSMSQSVMTVCKAVMVKEFLIYKTYMTFLLFKS